MFDFASGLELSCAFTGGNSRAGGEVTASMSMIEPKPVENNSRGSFWGDLGETGAEALFLNGNRSLITMETGSATTLPGGETGGSSVSGAGVASKPGDSILDLGFTGEGSEPTDTSKVRSRSASSSLEIETVFKGITSWPRGWFWGSNFFGGVVEGAGWTRGTAVAGVFTELEESGVEAIFLRLEGPWGCGASSSASWGDFRFLDFLATSCGGKNMGAEIAATLGARGGWKERGVGAGVEVEVDGLFPGKGGKVPRD